MTIISIGNLSSTQLDSLIKKLDETGFKVSGLSTDKVGPIDVKSPKPKHPSFSGCTLPVGFISIEEDVKYKFELVNTDEKFPEDYHSKLRDIYQSL